MQILLQSALTIRSALQPGAASTRLRSVPLPRSFLDTVEHVNVTTLSFLLLLMGGCTLWLLFLGNSVVAASLFLALWGVMNTAISVIWMTWMSQNAADAPEAAGSLMVAAIQASILLGAVLGGLLLDGLTIVAAFVGSAVLAGFAIALIGSGRRLLKPE